MKKLQILLAIAAMTFFISCSEEETPVQPDVKETDSIELIATEGTEIEGDMNTLPPGEQELIVSFHTEIKNKGTRDLKLFAKMEIMELDPEQTSYFCWGDPSTGDGICYQPMTTDFLSDRTLTVKAGETSPPGNFQQYVSNRSKFGANAKVRYIVYEDGNEDNRDTIIYSISFK